MLEDLDKDRKIDTVSILKKILHLRKLPKYPVELRVDIIFHIFLRKIFMAKFDDFEIESIIPQFLILPKPNKKENNENKENNNLRSANVDIAVFVKNNKNAADAGKKRAFFVELKTDNNSYDSGRLEHLR
ncbi:MAG: hypothetical protein LBE38_00175, partial [Deltaproteobacteria bacterium]|nr:hypothetical protein [Deltaproteobacteria bacterium]